MEKYYLIGAILLLVIIIVVIIMTVRKEKYDKHHEHKSKHHDHKSKHSIRYKLIIPPNGILVSRQNMQYGSDMPNYTIEQATEIYRRGVDVVNVYKKSQYKNWEESQLGANFQDIITAIMYRPDKADELTKGLDDFNNNRVIAAANISSLETMPQPADWITNYTFTDAHNAYKDTGEYLLNT